VDSSFYIGGGNIPLELRYEDVAKDLKAIF
jgi:hypothetical protein